MPDSLETLHQQIDALTDPDGEFAVVCPRSGKRPVPVRGKSFPSAQVAEDAVDLVVEYRQLLREVDPYLENVPIAACRRTPDPLSLEADERSDDDRRRTVSRGRNGSSRASRSVTLSGDAEEAWLRMEDAPVVRVREDGEPLDDAAVERQLDANL